MESSSGDTIDTRFINILFKGECQNDSVSQQDDEIYYQKDDDYIRAFAANNLEAITVPILKITYHDTKRFIELMENIKEESHDSFRSSAGVIISSPRVVEFLKRAADSYEKGDLLSKFNPHLVFPIGPKSAKLCQEKLGLGYNSESVDTGNSKNLAELIKRVTSGYVVPVLVCPLSNESPRNIVDLLKNVKRLSTRTFIAYETSRADKTLERIVQALETFKKPSDNRPIVINHIFFSCSNLKTFNAIDKEIYKSHCNSIFPDSSQIIYKYSAVPSCNSDLVISEVFKHHIFAIIDTPTPETLVTTVKTAIETYDKTSG